jgi:hypothetical protein
MVSGLFAPRRFRPAKIRRAGHANDYSYLEGSSHTRSSQVSGTVGKPCKQQHEFDDHDSRGRNPEREPGGIRNGSLSAVDQYARSGPRTSCVFQACGCAGARQRVARTMPLFMQWDENFDIGADTGAPVYPTTTRFRSASPASSTI